MRMTDLVSGLDISLFPSIGLVIFGLVFTLVLARTLMMSRRQAGHAASLPLDDAATGSTAVSKEARRG
jgi:cbb3-type cytochrome oxidase subunit 3